MEMTLLSMVVGPAGALVVMAVVIWWVARLVENKLVPAGEKFVSRHLDQIDRLIQSHDKDREVWSEGLTAMRVDMDAVKDDVHSIRQRIEVALGKTDA